MVRTPNSRMDIARFQHYDGGSFYYRKWSLHCKLNRWILLSSVFALVVCLVCCIQTRLYTLDTVNLGWRCTCQGMSNRTHFHTDGISPSIRLHCSISDTRSYLSQSAQTPPAHSLESASILHMHHLLLFVFCRSHPKWTALFWFQPTSPILSCKGHWK